MLPVIAFWVVCVFGTITNAEIEEEDNVLLLTDKNFQKALDENTLILIEFYAPWCGHCKELAPKYAEAAGVLKNKNSEIKLAKIDSTEHREVARRFGIQDKVHPIIKFFRSTQPIDYKGERTADGIVSWVERKSKPSLVQLTSLEDVQEFIVKNEIAIIGLFKDQRSWAVGNLVAVAENLEGYGYEFGITSHPDVFKDYEVNNDDIILFKAFDEGRNDFKGKRGWGVEYITDFIISNSMPLLIEFSPKLAPRILANEKGTLFFITSSNSGEYSSQKEMVERIGKDWKGKLLIAILDVEADGNKEFLGRLGVEENEIPAIRFAKGIKEKYAFQTDDELSEAKIRVFIQDVLQGRIQPIKYTKSEEIPDGWDKGPVKTLVGKNFHDVVNSNKKTFVYFYTPSFNTCLDLEPVWEQLGEDFKDRHEIQIAKMDSSVNEVDALDVTLFPTMLFFQNSVKRSAQFNDEQTVEGFLRYLERKGIVRPQRIRDEL